MVATWCGEGWRDLGMTAVVSDLVLVLAVWLSIGDYPLERWVLVWFGLGTFDLSERKLALCADKKRWHTWLSS